MVSKKLLWRKATRALLWAGGVAVFVSANCGEPEEAAESRWVNIGDLPTYVYRVNAMSGSGGFYIVAEGFIQNEQTHLVLRRSRREFSIEFVMDAYYEDGWLADVAYHKGTLWISGSDASGNEIVPLVLRKANLGKWEEVPVPYYPDGTVSTVVPINDSDFWFLIDDYYYDGTHDGLLAKYEGGKVNTYYGFGGVTIVRTTVPKVPPTLYVVKFGGKQRGAGEPVKIFITADGGASWKEETLPADVAPGHDVVWAVAGAAHGVDLHLIVKLGHGAGGYYGVVKRTGPPGGGEYELVFLAPLNPYFRDITSIAFEDPRHERYGIAVDGVAVGDQSTVVFDAGAVYLERLAYPISFFQVVPATGSGFFAVGKNQAFGGYELLYHP